MAAKVQRSERLLERIKERTGMTEDGKDWLIAVMDPLHDEKLKCNGYPDRNVGPSVVQVIKQSFDISKPSTYGANDVWGFHLWMDDYLCNDVALSGQQAFLTVENQNVLMDTTGTFGVGNQLPVGGLCGVCFDQTVNAGVDTIIIPPSFSGTDNAPAINPTLFPDTSQLNPSFLQGKVRKIAEGFEVCNTTAELYRGGSVLVYEQPSSKNDPTAYSVRVTSSSLPDDIIEKYGKENIYVEKSRTIKFSKTKEINLEETDESLAGKKAEIEDVEEIHTPTKYYALVKNEKVYLDKFLVTVDRFTVQTCAIDNLPPRNIAEAMILPGTQQWGAEEGCYVVQTMDCLDNPPTFANTMSSIWTADELRYPNRSIAPDTWGNNIANKTFPVFNSSNNIQDFKSNFKTPFNKKGCIFSGLTPQSTFKVNRTVVIERFISSKDPNLAVLAKMAPSEDYVALQLYAEVSRFMPVGTKFKNNGFGDWFLSCVDSVVETVSEIGKPLMGALKGYQDVRSGGNPNSNQSAAPVTIVKTVQAKQPYRKPLPRPPQKKNPPKPLPKPPARKMKPLPPIPKKK
jgi:hypothetical protein